MSDFDSPLDQRILDRMVDGELTDGAKLANSPFGQAVDVDGTSGSVVVPRDDRMNVGDSEFSVAAWIRPREESRHA